MRKPAFLAYAKTKPLFSLRINTILEEYRNKWKLAVNAGKTKNMVFRKVGRLRDDLNFIYNNSQIEIVNKFCYLRVVFTAGGSNFETQKTLAGRASKAIFT